MTSNLKDFLLSSYDYDLPADLIAQQPLNPRHKARLMVVPKPSEDLSFVRNCMVWDLLSEIKPGDLIVMNDTRVLKARLKVRLAGGTLAEVLLLEPYGSGRWLCLGKPAKKMREGDYLFLEKLNHDHLKLKVLSKDLATGGRVIQFPSCFSTRDEIESLLDVYGEVPLPPYIKHHDSSSAERYQTRYASQPGAVASPTAGLHLSDELLGCLTKRGIKQVKITLHVGLGTFRPLEIEDLRSLKLHSEIVQVKKEVVQAIKDCKSHGGKVFAVGTTTVRALESAWLTGQGVLQPFQGAVNLVIKPGFNFGVVDGLLTNFHLPKSSLLLLVSALIGRERLLALYKRAIENQYRFFSYGDAMLITPEAVLANARFRP